MFQERDILYCTVQMRRQHLVADHCASHSANPSGISARDACPIFLFHFCTGGLARSPSPERLLTLRLPSQQRKDRLSSCHRRLLQLRPREYKYFFTHLYICGICMRYHIKQAFQKALNYSLQNTIHKAICRPIKYYYHLPFCGHFAR